MIGKNAPSALPCYVPPVTHYLMLKDKEMFYSLPWGYLCPQTRPIECVGLNKRAMRQRDKQAHQGSWGPLAGSRFVVLVLLVYVVSNPLLSVVVLCCRPYCHCPALSSALSLSFCVISFV